MSSLRHRLVFVLVTFALSAADAQNPVPRPQTPAAVVGLFVAACVRHEGSASAVIDWALAQGFEPVGAARTEPLPPLLDGAAGGVLVMPGSGGDVLLAAADDDRCTVWADRQSGPALRLALQRELDVLTGQGAHVRVAADRHVQHTGQWRNVLHWSYRRAAAARELNIGAVTTLGGNLAAQALDLRPAPAAMPPDAGGTPGR